MKMEENKKILETNKIEEYIPTQDNKIVFENDSAKEYITADEIVTDDEKTTISKPQSKKSSTLSLSASLTAAISAAVVGMTTLMNVNLDATFDEENCGYYDGKIELTINVEELTDDVSLNSYVYEDGKLIDTIELKDEDGDQIIKITIPIDQESVQAKLDAGDNVSVKYKVDLKGEVGLNVSRSFDSYTVKIEKFKSVINSVDMYCSCGVDGYYNFKVDYDDPFGKFSEFKAYIEDGNGNKSYCQFTSNYHDWQHIYVNSLVGSSCKFYLSYMVDGVETYMQFTNDDSGNLDNYKNINL